MSWIRVIERSAAGEELKRLYERIAGPAGHVDNVLTVHSLRPHTLEGHMRLYKSVLHHRDNKLPKTYLESLGVFVSALNRCDYCVAHHAAGLGRLLSDDAETETIVEDILSGALQNSFEGRWLEGMHYARRLTKQPETIAKEDVERLREFGFSDGEILEINQVVSYFNYVNRTVLGLGVDVAKEPLGLSPSDTRDTENWGHV